VTANTHFTVIGGDEAKHYLHQRGLAGAVVTKQRHTLARRDRE
jgi:hypothetical protein